MKTRMTLAGVVVAAATAGAFGSITSVSGQTTYLGVAPASCVPSALAGFNAYAWDEQQGLMNSAGVFCDMVNNPGVSTAPIPGLLFGTFDSHFIHYENVPGVISASGTVTFSGNIVGVEFNPGSLDNTDAFWGATGTVYPTGYPFRGLNTIPQSVVSINGNVLSFNFFSIAPTNDLVQVRVFTDHVPAPGAGALLALAGVVAGRRRR